MRCSNHGSGIGNTGLPRSRNGRHFSGPGPGSLCQRRAMMTMSGADVRRKGTAVVSWRECLPRRRTFLLTSAVTGGLLLGGIVPASPSSAQQGDFAGHKGLRVRHVASTWAPDGGRTVVDFNDRSQCVVKIVAHPANGRGRVVVRYTDAAHQTQKWKGATIDTRRRVLPPTDPEMRVTGNVQSLRQRATWNGMGYASYMLRGAEYVHLRLGTEVYRYNMTALNRYTPEHAARVYAFRDAVNSAADLEISAFRAARARAALAGLSTTALGFTVAAKDLQTRWLGSGFAGVPLEAACAAVAVGGYSLLQSWLDYRRFRGAAQDRWNELHRAEAVFPAVAGFRAGGPLGDPVPVPGTDHNARR